MKLNIITENLQENFAVTDELSDLVYHAIAETLHLEDIDFDCSVSLTYTDNAGIRTLNREYRGKDTATDVLSFPMFDPEIEEVYAMEGAPAELGDILISL